MSADRTADTGDHAATPRVAALERGFQVLRALSRSGPSTLAEVVEATLLNKSTTYYTLRTLVALDAVRYEARSKSYSLGPALIELGTVAGQQYDSMSMARGELAAVMAQIEATVVIYRRIGRSEVVIADRIDRAHGVRITVEPGTRLPIQGGSFGRAFLAFDPPEVLTEVLTDGLVPFTSRSTTEVAEFRSDLAAVRDVGWAVDHEGFALGVSTVAAPIFEPGGAVQLVAAAVGFTSAFDEATTQRYGQLLRAACDRAGLPFVPSPGRG
jgi:DNA-binding IclR family transcriptional regulator